MNKVWTEAQKAFIRDNAEKMLDKDMAAHLQNVLGRKVSLQAVRKQRQKLGLHKESGRGKSKLKGVVAKLPPLDTQPKDEANVQVDKEAVTENS